jgi:O-antigen/teichoic acid export membrane protein
MAKRNDPVYRGRGALEHRLSFDRTARESKIVSGRRRSAALAVLFGYASLLISLARNILFVPIYLHGIPLAEYGAWLATGGALALILINDFGLSGVVIQKISMNFGAGDFKALGTLAGSALAIGSLMALLLSALSLACLPLLPGLQSLTELQKHTVVNCFLIAVGANALGLAATTAMSVIRSLQMAVAAGSIVLAADVANVTVTLLGLLHGSGLYAIAFGMLARSAVLAVTGGAGLAIICSRSVPMTLVFSWRAVRELLGDATRFFFSSIAMKMQSQANVVFVGSILGPSSAAIYSLTIRAHETVMMLIGQFNSALVPAVTHLFGSGNVVRFRAVLLRLLLSVGAVSALAFSITAILNAGFLRLWLVNQHFLGQDVSILMAIALFVSSIGFVAYDALVSQGKFNFVSKVFICSSLLQLLLLALFLRLGLWVAPAVSLICALVWGSWFWGCVNAGIHLTSAERRSLVLDLSCLAGVSAVTAAGFLVFYPAVNTWWSFIAEGVLSIIVLVLGYLLFSSTIRTIAREEIWMTLRALRPT